MAGNESQKKLISLIRDFATEKSQGERRVVNLKKRIQELRSELEVANAGLDDAKLLKETTEQELRGYEVELAMNEASIQTLEARISATQNEISAAGSELENLKNDERELRDCFIEKMFMLNAEIRKFQETINCAFVEDNWISMASNDDAGPQHTNGENAEFADTDLDNNDQIISK